MRIQVGVIDKGVCPRQYLLVSPLTPTQPIENTDRVDVDVKGKRLFRCKPGKRHV